MPDGMTPDRAALRATAMGARSDLERTGKPAAMYQRELAQGVLALLDTLDTAEAEVARLTALVHAKESWIDGAKVDLEGLESDVQRWVDSHAVLVREVAGLRESVAAEFAPKVTAAMLSAYGLGRDDEAAGNPIRTPLNVVEAALPTDVPMSQDRGHDLRERIAQAIDQAWAEAKDRRQKSEYREGYLDGLELAEGIARSAGLGEGVEVAPSPMRDEPAPSPDDLRGACSRALVAVAVERDRARARASRLADEAEAQGRATLFAERERDEARAAARDANDRLDKVRALHFPSEPVDFCRGCGFTYPCVTVRALDGAS